MSDSVSSSSDPDSPPSKEAPSHLRVWGRRILQAVGLATGILLLIIGTLFIGLQTEFGATTAAQWLSNAANPLANTEVTVERASGNWLRSLHLTNVTLTRPGADADAPMAHVDTLSARYRLLPLLQGRLHVTEVTVAGPAVTARQAADSTWNWARALPASTEDEAPADSGAAFSIRVDDITVRRGRASTVFYAKNQDSTAHVRALRLHAHNLTSDSTITGRLDTLSLRAQLPTARVPDLQMGLQGALSASAFTVEAFQLDSPRSRVRGHGTVPLPNARDQSANEIDLHLRAAPLSLRDLTPLLPPLDVDPTETVRLTLQATGSPNRMTAQMEGRFSNGGTLSAQALASPLFPTADSDSSRQYQLDAEVQNLTTSLLGPPDPSANRLNATASADLEGPALTSLNGPTALRLTETHWNGLYTSNLAFSSTLRDGTASFTLDGTVNDATIHARGRTRPLDDAPDATLTAQVQALNLANVFPDAGLESDLSSTGTLTARALGTDMQTVDVSVELDRSRLGVQAITGGTLTATLQPERAQFESTLDLPTGTAHADGSAALDDSERFELDSMRLDNINPAALAGDTTSSRLTGTATLEGRGFDPETTHLDASIALTDSHYGPYRLSSLRTQASLTDAELGSTTNATLNGSNWALELTGRPFADSPVFELARGRFQDVDIGPFLQDTTQSSLLTGTIQGRVRGTDPATMTADAALTLDTSRVNRQPIESASLDLRLQDGQIDSEFALDLPEGGTRFVATAQPFADVPTAQVTEGAFDALNVGAFADLPGLHTALSGAFTLEARGATTETLALDADLSFSSSRVNDASLSKGSLTVSTQEGQGRAQGTFSIAGGRIGLNGTVDELNETPSYTARTTVRSVNVGALAGLDSMTARIDTLHWTLDGRGTTPNTLTATTRLVAGDVEVDAFTLHATRLSGRFRRGQLAVDTLNIRSNAFVGAGSGTLAVTNADAASNFSLQAGITNAKPLGRVVGADQFRLGSGRAEMRIYGSSLATQRFDGEVELKNLLYNDLRLAEAEFNFNGRRGEEQRFQRVELNGRLGYLSVPTLSANETQLNATYDGTTVDLSTDVRLDPSHTASLKTRIRPGEPTTEITLQQLTLDFKDDEWTLLQETTLTVGDQYRVRGLLLHSGPQQIAVDGIINPQGTQSLVATVEQVRLDTFSSLVGLSGAKGRLSGSVDLTGSADAPKLDSRLSLALRTADQDVGTLRLNADYSDLALSLDATLTHKDGSTLTVKGRIPTDLRLRAVRPVDISTRPVRLDLSTERFAINWIDPFLDPGSVRNIRGILAADVEVRGTRADPDFTGTASLANGGLTLPPLETTYSNATASLRFSDDQLRLDEATLRSSNDGRLRATGVVNFPQLTVGEFDLRLNADDFIAVDTQAYRRAVIGGTMTLQGTITEPTLEGAVRVRSGEIFYNEALAANGGGPTAVSLTAKDKLTLENRFGLRLSAADTTTVDAYKALQMDLTVRIRRNTWLRSESNPELNVQFTGDLDLSKKPNRDAKVFGSVNVVPGRSTVRQFGQEFQMTEGRLTFNGDPTTPYLTLQAVYEQRARGAQGSEVKITLGLKGRPASLSPTLSSDPPMNTRDILSYLATGRPADELLSGGGEGGGNMATQMALGQASSVVENLAASELGLDVVRVQLRTSGVSYLTVGRYLTPRFFASIQQPITTSNLSSFQTNQNLPDLTLEYQLVDTLILRARNSRQSLQMDLLFEYAY